MCRYFLIRRQEQDNPFRSRSINLNICASRENQNTIIICINVQWRRSEVKSRGGVKIEKSEGVGSGEGLCPPQLVVWGVPPGKNRFRATDYAILSQFGYFFPILQHMNFQHAKIVTSASEKLGDYPAVLKVGTYPPPTAPTPMLMFKTCTSLH